MGPDASQSPYRTGFCVVVDDDGPPGWSISRSGSGQTWGEADGVAGHAVADLEVKLAGGAHRVGDQLVGARVIDGDRRARWR